MAAVRLLGLEDPSIDFTFKENPERAINFEGLQKWASFPIPRQEGSILHNMGAEALMFNWTGVIDGEDAFSDLTILDGLRRSGAPLKLQYLDINIECVILSFNFRLETPRAELDRWYYEIKFQRYYPNLAVSRLAPLEISLTGQQISTLSNKMTDLDNQLSTFDGILASLTDGDILGAVTGVSEAVTDALASSTDALNNLRQGIQEPLYVLQGIQQELQDASTLVKQSLENVESILNTPDEIMTTLREMSVSLDFIAAAPFVSVSDVTTVVVEQNDTIEGLAQAFYGSFESWRVIVNANKAIIPDPHNLPVGATLTIPL